MTAPPPDESTPADIKNSQATTSKRGGRKQKLPASNKRTTKAKPPAAKRGRVDYLSSSDESDDDTPKKKPARVPVTTNSTCTLDTASTTPNASSVASSPDKKATALPDATPNKIPLTASTPSKEAHSSSDTATTPRKGWTSGDNSSSPSKAANKKPGLNLHRMSDSGGSDDEVSDTSKLTDASKPMKNAASSKVTQIVSNTTSTGKYQAYLHLATTHCMLISLVMCLLIKLNYFYGLKHFPIFCIY